jgi:CheY-like chemotaxis protein
MTKTQTTPKPERAVLVVDDEENMLAFIQTTLVREGLRVELALNGRQALEKIKQHQFSAIITDIKMPEMDGLELIRRAKRLPQAKNVPIILITGMGENRPVVEGLRAGAVFFLTKPFSPARLRQLVFAVIK